MKNYVFGDTGGHAKQLFTALREIGIEPRDGIIPKGKRVVHCGDLIHKGPNSKVLLAVVDTLIRQNPGQWEQILGNHEFQHISGSPVFWRCDCDAEDIEIINAWFDEGLAKATFAVDEAHDVAISVKPRVPLHAEKGMFFSHAGLTRKWWEVYIGPDRTLEEGSRLMNSQPVYMLTQPGEMLTGRTNLAAGPAWATGNNEVYNSWVDPDSSEFIDMDFVQVHGHSLSFDWKSKKWWARTDRSFRDFKNDTKLDETNRAVVTSMAGGTLIGIDPGYSKLADNEKQTYLTFDTP